MVINAAGALTAAVVLLAICVPGGPSAVWGRLAYAVSAVATLAWMLSMPFVRMSAAAAAAFGWKCDMRDVYSSGGKVPGDFAPELRCICAATWIFLELLAPSLPVRALIWLLRMMWMPLLMMLCLAVLVRVSIALFGSAPRLSPRQGLVLEPVPSEWCAEAARAPPIQQMQNEKSVCIAWLRYWLIYEPTSMQLLVGLVLGMVGTGYLLPNWTCGGNVIAVVPVGVAVAPLARVLSGAPRNSSSPKQTIVNSLVGALGVSVVAPIVYRW